MPSADPGRFERFGFDPSYEIELEPEFPADGTWEHAVHGFDHDGQLVDPFVSRWGAPLALIARPAESEPWVGLFPHSGASGVSGAFAMPDREALLVSVGGAAFVVNVDRPNEGALIASSSIQHVFAVDGTTLLLSSCTRLAAFGPEGYLWQSAHLVLDDLRIVSGVGNVIRCTGLGQDGQEALLEVDAHTGLQIA